MSREESPVRDLHARRMPASDDGALARLIVDQLADAVIIVDREGIVRFANPAAARLFGRDGTEDQPLVGEPFGFPILLDEIAEVELVRRGGEPLAAELRAVEIPWQGTTARLLSLRDVTERNRMARRIVELERQRGEAEASNRAKADFLATMSHELRTPLNAIMGYAQLLELGIAAPLTKEQRQQVRRISNSAHHLLSLVNDILDLTKIDAGRLSVAHGQGSLVDALQRSLELVRPSASGRRVMLGVVCEVDEPLYRGDESRVRQVLVNLLQNAVKFTPPGGRVTATCGIAAVAPNEARLARVGPWAFVRVDDTGVGIPASRLAAIFDPFVRVETGHTRRTDGSGLGLSISRRLARLMDGDITVESDEGKGSSFTLWLPSAEQAAEAPLDGAGAPPASQEAEPLPLDAATLAAGVADVGEVLLRESAGIVASLVLRLRHDGHAQAAAALHYPDLANHFVSFVAVLSETLMTRAEAGAMRAQLIEEGLEMLHALAERHGVQRARLGFSEGAVEREWELLQEEIDRALAEHTGQLQPKAVSDALALIRRSVLQAQMRSRRTWRAAARATSASQA